VLSVKDRQKRGVKREKGKKTGKRNEVKAQQKKGYWVEGREKSRSINNKKRREGKDRPGKGWGRWREKGGGGKGGNTNFQMRRKHQDPTQTLVQREIPTVLKSFWRGVCKGERVTIKKKKTGTGGGDVGKCWVFEGLALAELPSLGTGKKKINQRAQLKGGQEN